MDENEDRRLDDEHERGQPGHESAQHDAHHEPTPPHESPTTSPFDALEATNG